MNQNSKRFTAVLSLVALLFIGVTSANAQIVVAEDFRPFDFSNKYYEENGILPPMLVDRKNGADGRSVVDFNPDPNFSQVRITATRPAYTGSGGVYFWNYYAGVPHDGFTSDERGTYAMEQANLDPMYVFPSAADPASDRQAAMMLISDSYYQKNPLGLAAVWVVEYTRQIYTYAGRKRMQQLAAQNGLSIDGTPIIRYADELKELENTGFVTITPAGGDGSGRMPFAVAKLLNTNALGSVAGDAFLIFVKAEGGNPLPTEQIFLSKFECLQSGSACSR